MKNTYLVCFSSNSGDNHCSFSSEKKARKYIAGELRTNNTHLSDFIKINFVCRLGGENMGWFL